MPFCIGFSILLEYVAMCYTSLWGSYSLYMEKIRITRLDQGIADPLIYKRWWRGSISKLPSSSQISQFANSDPYSRELLQIIAELKRDRRSCSALSLSLSLSLSLFGRHRNQRQSAGGSTNPASHWMTNRMLEAHSDEVLRPRETPHSLHAIVLPTVEDGEVNEPAGCDKHCCWT